MGAIGLEAVEAQTFQPVYENCPVNSEIEKYELGDATPVLYR